MIDLKTNSLFTDNYCFLVTVLNYEIFLEKLLSELSFSGFVDDSRKIIVDLALLTGINKYRFAEYALDRYGKLILQSYRYVQLDKNIEDVANKYLSCETDIVKNSMLPISKKQYILNSK